MSTYKKIQENTIEIINKIAIIIINEKIMLSDGNPEIK